ncbi:helicase C-terminal domain-containing protein [Clostridium uliginosum]|uniref:ATP-dependent DNA helicase DinG n=1 Tax=Clostridium uliginosum TaxID=119641 RepID=A0A1I1HAC2_9CLOT|nr:helicase C-terminal domain-containing protein [Clostridium uliginosum]SFC21089.1 ATP-dependent DNA helicase DinG [Clostridium uliginosum]
MIENLNSVLDNVIYLDIETTGLNEESCEIIEIGAVKIKDSVITTYQTLIKPNGVVPVSIYKLCAGLNEDELMNARALDDIKNELVDFLENLPLICHNGGFENKFLSYHIPEIKNKIIDSMELASILEPWRKEYNLDSLLREVTSIDKNELHRGLEDSIDTLKVVNSLLCREWTREESRKGKKSLYSIINKSYEFLKSWDWKEYLLKPILFTIEEYPYVSYEENKKEEIKFKKILVDYEKYEELLLNEEIWNNGGDFGYQYREDQKNFSKNIRENIEENTRMFIEAPTGSGKTFAYLLIAVTKAYLNQKNKKQDDASYFISTNTKELQNQLIDKDIPMILKKLGLEDKLNYGAMKGKRNYICIDRLNKCDALIESKEGNLSQLFLRRLCEDGKYGDIENISYWAYNHFEIDKYLNEINCDNEACNLDRCIKPCYLRKRYNELPKENITVINHSLLACYPYCEKKKINHLIIDEAHNLMEKCYDFFCEEFSSYEFIELLNQIEKGHPSIYSQLRSLNAAFGYRETIELDKLKHLVEDINTNIAILLNEFRRMGLIEGTYNFTTEFFLPKEELQESMKVLSSQISNLKECIYPLYKMINDYVKNITLEDEITGDRDYKNLSDYIKKVKDVFDILDKFLEKSTFYAKVLEIDVEYKGFMLRNIPLNVGELVNEHMLKEVKSTTFLSATLRIENSFDKIKKHLAQENSKEFIIPPTFNLKQRTKIFGLNDIGAYDSPYYIKNMADFIFNTAKKLNGHILVLFNNNKRKQEVFEELDLLTRGSKIEVHTNRKAIPILNDKNRIVIILGGKGFFEGIDVAGEGLTCVMLDKLPNHSIEYPILKAVTNYQNKRYQDVNYPQLCIKLKQIYGRLIRSTLDYGYFIILDPGKNYNTIRNIERDLGGPEIQITGCNMVLDVMDDDYNFWKKYNLNLIIKDIKKNKQDIKNDFNNEAKKHKLFWELLGCKDGQYYFRNINYVLKAKQ